MRDSLMTMLAPAVALSSTVALASIGAETGPDWVAGYAELSRFRVTHERYGEVREGDIVLVYVKEDFLPDRQVKYEGGTTPEQPVRVLKLNEIRRFTTGVADYSLMRSVFTSVADGRTMKVTASAQDWCGQTWAQLNRRDDGWRLVSHSYFMADGDQDVRIPDARVEDGLWTQLRLDPETLPVGRVTLIPGVLSQRLEKSPSRPAMAQARLSPAREGMRTYRVAYDEGGRVLEIDFREKAPHAIEAFRELRDGRVIVNAVCTHRIETDYWNDLALSDDGLRARLGLD